MSNNKNIDSAYTQMEVNRGRTELRSIEVSNQTQLISAEWKGLSQLICVHRICRSKERKSEEKAYFISSRKANAFLYAEGIRLHWRIENALHWVKDVTLGEDDSKIRTGSAPQNLSTMKNIALNILRKNFSGTLTQSIRMIANNIKELKNLIM
jgi:predicted transposase YbfD/YdcC